jgi:hypothetical protein
MGLLAALVQMSNVRLAMAVIPAMGRESFSLSTGGRQCVPGPGAYRLGLLIDAVGTRPQPGSR